MAELAIQEMAERLRTASENAGRIAVLRQKIDNPGEDWYLEMVGLDFSDEPVTDFEVRLELYDRYDGSRNVDRYVSLTDALSPELVKELELELETSIEKEKVRRQRESFRIRRSAEKAKKDREEFEAFKKAKRKGEL